MKKNISSFQYYLTLFVAVLGTGALSYSYFNHQYQMNKQETSKNSDLAQVDELYEKIMTQYVGEVDKKTLIDGALQGMTEAIGDPYSTYLPQEDAKNLENSLASSLEGIGASLTLQGDTVEIAQAPLSGTPAEKAGLKKGDQLLEVDGTSTAGETLDEVVARVRGKKGTDVKLKIKRGNETLDFSITRAEIPIASVESKMQNATTGLLTISSFSENTAAEFKEQITALRKEGAKAFIFDVRQNPGGLLDQVVKMSSMVLKDGEVIVKWEDKAGGKYQDAASASLDDGFKVTEPVAVLVDGNSASAAEIFAGAIKDNKRGKVIGMTTYGKGTMQDVEGLGNEKLKLTTGKWYTPNGTWVNEKGLAPDVEVNYPEFAYLPPLSGEKVYQKGAVSEDVIILKTMLKALGYSFKDLSENFDEETVSVVKDFQTKNQLTVNGTWDEATNAKVQEQLIALLKNQDAFVEKALEVLGESHDQR